MPYSKVFDYTSFQPLSDDVDVKPSFYSDLSDVQLAEVVVKHTRPVKSERNIWAYWHSGWDTMQPWRQRTVLDWARRQGPDWEIRVLDSVSGSPWHFTRWTDERWYPQCMLDGTLKHGQAPQHLSDAVRVVTVIEHGGFFLDPGLILTRDLEDSCWRRMVDPSDPMEMVIAVVTDPVGPDLVLQAFIGARKGNPFLAAWQQLYAALWDKYGTSPAGMSLDPLLHPFPRAEMNPIVQEVVGEDITETKMNDYIIHALTASRLTRIEFPSPGSISPAKPSSSSSSSSSCYAGPVVSVSNPLSPYHLSNPARYWCDHVRMIPMNAMMPSLPISAEDEFGAKDEELYARLCLPYDPENESNSDRQYRTHGMVSRFFTHAVCYKATSGIQSAPTLARLWNVDADADNRSGTWAEYLRWGRIHLVPKGELRLLRKGDKELRKSTTVWKVDLLEPVNPETETYEIAI